MSRHILLIVLDQFRADCVYGALAQTVALPNLQGLMSDATTFTNHYTVTTPCGPARASLLTGLYAMNHRSVRNGTPLASHHKNIGQLLRSAGFESMLFGYTDTSVDPGSVHPDDPALKNYEGLADGFSQMLHMRLETPGPWFGYLKNRGYKVPDNYWDLYKAVLDASTATEQDPLGSPIRSPALYQAQDSDTAFLTDRTIEAWEGLREQDDFSLVTYLRPHPPWVAPAPYNTLIDPEAVPPPMRSASVDTLIRSHPFYKTFLEGATGKEQLSHRHVAEMRAVYLGLAAEVDHHIGRLLQYLKDRGRYEDTLIVVTADHGEMLGDQFLWGKQAPLDAALHIPLIVRDPAHQPMRGQIINAFTESVDIAPTLMEWARGDTVPAFNGRSLMPWLRGESVNDWRSFVFAEAELGEPDEPTHYQRHLNLSMQQSNFAVYREQHYKYVHFNGGIAPMLFDLLEDPHENSNLADDPSHQSTLQSMMSKMIDHRMSYADHALSGMKIRPSGLYTP